MVPNDDESDSTTESLIERLMSDPILIQLRNVRSRVGEQLLSTTGDESTNIGLLIQGDVEHELYVYRYVAFNNMIAEFNSRF